VTVTVVFNGEICWLNGGYSVQILDAETLRTSPEIVFELVAVESASVKGHYRGSFVKSGHFVFLPSSIKFEDSEWSQGVSDGNFNA